MNDATERLRAMLDERGIEYIENDFGITWSYYNDPHTATESMDGTLIVTGLTPEQAIEATLGRGECERLQDENERLRSCLSDSAENAKQIMHEAHVQEAENAKLRELVRDVFTIHWHGLDCTECPKRFQDRCTHLGGCEWLGILSDRMRELGVEV